MLEVGDHDIESATFEELVEGDWVNPLKGRPELIRLGSGGLQPFGDLTSVDTVHPQPTVRLASVHATHFAWAN